MFTRSDVLMADDYGVVDDGEIVRVYCRRCGTWRTIHEFVGETSPQNSVGAALRSIIVHESEAH